MSSKRAVIINVQFNIFFILLIGAVMIVFFIAMSNALKRSNEAKIEVEINSLYDGVLDRVQRSEGVVSVISLLKYELVLDQGDDTCDFLSITGTNREGKNVMQQPIFGPSVIKRRIVAHSSDIRLPFVTASAVYLTSPDIAYVLINPDQELIGLFEAFQGNATIIQTADPSSITNDGYYKIRFISRNAPGSLNPSGLSLPNKDVSFIQVSPDRVSFFGSNPSGFHLIGETLYFDDSTLLGALISEDDSYYECQIMKVTDRLAMQSKLFAKSTDRLRMQNNPYCQAFDAEYQDITSKLLLMGNMAQNYMGILDIYTLNSKIEEIRAINNLVVRAGCPSIY
jgi:hypothetical protein